MLWNQIYYKKNSFRETIVQQQVDISTLAGNYMTTITLKRKMDEKNKKWKSKLK